MNYFVFHKSGGVILKLSWVLKIIYVEPERIANVVCIEPKEVFHKSADISAGS